jgi:HD-like signal output (HDOD) protein
MNTSVADTIQTLPPLPKTVIELTKFKKKKDKDPDELKLIIDNDPLIVSMLLKISNSPMFGFKSDIKSTKTVINLLGMNFTISVALGSSIKNIIEVDLSPYGITTDTFMKLSSMKTNLLTRWYGKSDFRLKEDLILPAFLYDTGKFVLSTVLHNEDKAQEFSSALSASLDVLQVEKEILGYTTGEITSAVFKHWNLGEDLIESILYVDNPEESPLKYKKTAQVLNILNTLCNVKEPMGEEYIDIAIKNAEEWELDEVTLRESIDSISSQL